MGHQLHAQHPPQERAGVLGGHPEALHAHTREPGRQPHRSGVAQPGHGPARKAVRHRGRDARVGRGRRRERPPAGHRLRPQVRGLRRAEPGHHLPDRFRPGGSRRPAGQPHPLRPLLSRKTGLLPGELGAVQRRHQQRRLARGGPVLQPAHRSLADGRSDSHPRRRPAHREGGAQQHRHHGHPDRWPVRRPRRGDAGPRRRELFRRALQPRHHGALEGGCAGDQQARGQRRLRQPHLRRGHNPGPASLLPGEQLYRQDLHHGSG